MTANIRNPLQPARGKSKPAARRQIICAFCHSHRRLARSRPQRL